MKHQVMLDDDKTLELIFIYLTEVAELKSYDDMLSVLADMGRALTNSDRCTVWVVSDDKKKLWTKVAHGVDSIEIDINSGLVGAAIKSQQRIIIDDVYQDERFNKEVDKKTGYRTKSMMVIPMFGANDEVIGAFQAINNKREEGVYNNEDLRRLMLASTYAAETLVAVRLTQEIEETQREVVFTMGAIAESRSKETGNHVKRVAEYTKILALAYGLSEEESELLKQASPMHDIGKVAIPDAILNKPGRFTPEERKIMDTHAELGYMMINQSDRPLMKAASIVAHEHHEKWDGSGYPRGLSGEDIHIYGRITALADVFDALGSDRVYKKAWDDERIFKLFEEEKAKHFDPRLIELFFENLDAILTIREEFNDEYVPQALEEDSSRYTIKILGAYGTKAKGFGTTSFALNNQNVIDAGNLLDGMQNDVANVQNIWLTHSHLDHIADIAYIIDNYFVDFKETINIHGLPETIEVVQKHFLNDLIWPDFSKINLLHSDKKCIQYVPIELEKRYALSEDEYIMPFETDHTVPSCGYVFSRGEHSVLITADTYSLQKAIEIINRDQTIKSIVVECSFPSEMQGLALESKHLTPKLLSKEFEKLTRDDITVYIHHIKPQFLIKVCEEIDEFCHKYKPIVLKDNEIIKF